MYPMNVIKLGELFLNSSIFFFNDKILWVNAHIHVSMSQDLQTVAVYDKDNIEYTSSLFAESLWQK